MCQLGANPVKQFLVGTAIALVSAFLGYVASWLRKKRNDEKRRHIGRQGMKLFKFRIPKERLDSIPENERIFFVQMGIFLNELSTLQKFAYYSSKDVANETVRKAQNSQALFIFRMLAGTALEAWNLIHKKFYGTGLSKEYDGSLTDVGKASLRKLKDYFSKDNLIHTIRNNFAFHYSSDDVKKLIEETPKSEVFELYFSESHGNCFYHMSHVLVNSAMLKKTGSSDLQQAIDTLLSDINKTTDWLLDFFGECMDVIAKKYLGLDYEEETIPDPPKIDDVISPYFVERH